MHRALHWLWLYYSQPVQHLRFNTIIYTLYFKHEFIKIFYRLSIASAFDVWKLGSGISPLGIQLFYRIWKHSIHIHINRIKININWPITDSFMIVWSIIFQVWVNWGTLVYYVCTYQYMLYVCLKVGMIYWYRSLKYSFQGVGNGGILVYYLFIID